MDRQTVIEKIWRYSINTGEYGGIVIADSLEDAESKVRHKYPNKEKICVWKMIDDDYFDEKNPDVWECYGI